ncbi:MAG: biopolymer transporter ExbD [Opitutales bacterium]
MAKKKRFKSIVTDDDKYDNTSMIDVVFLLLIYFMCLPIQQEADLFLQLPVNIPNENQDTSLPSEQLIEINPDGSIALNQNPMDAPGLIEFNELTSTLTRLKASADKSGVLTIVTIIADSDSPHQATISVLDSCKKANISSVSFAKSI